MKAHDLAKILLSMENVEVFFQYYDGGPDRYYESLIDNVTECNGDIYLTRGELCKHNGISTDNIEYLSCFSVDINNGTTCYIGDIQDNIAERLRFLHNHPHCRVYADQVDNYANVYFETLEAIVEFNNMFK